MRTTTIRAAVAAAITIAAASAALPSFADKTLNDGLVAYLPFDNSTTENAVAGSPVAPEASTATAPALANNGMVGKCLNIPSGAYVKLTGSDSVTLAENSLGFEDSNKSFTAIIWANYGKQTKDPLLFANKGWSSGYLKGVLLCAQGDTANAQFNAAAGAAANRFDKYFTGEGSGKWTFYAMVCKSGSFTLYQGKSDGTLSSQTASSSGFDMNTGCPFYLAQDGTGNYSNGARPFIGKLDDFALWNRALSADDITRIYEFGRSGAGLGELLKIDANDAPTMEVVKDSETQYTLTFSGRRTKTHALYVAYGADDGKEDKYAWNSFEKLDDIPVDTSSYTYTVPDALFAINARFRFFLMQTNSLPYVKEVEYAHSDGTAWIDSGIAPRRELITEFNMRLTADNGSYQNFFGAFTVDGNKKSNYGMCRRNSKWDREYNTNVGSGSPYQFTGSCILNTDYHVVFTTTNLFVNGADTSGGGGITLSQFVEGGTPTINIFRDEKLKSDGTFATYDQTMVGYFKDFALYTPKHKVRDYVPVEDAGGTVGLFDRVTGQFQSSAGTALTAGADQDATRYGWVRCVSEPHLASATIPFTATYTGGGTDPLDFADGANWNCTNAFGFVLSADTIPTIDTDVTVSGTTAFQVTNGAMFACKSLKFDNAVPPDNADLRGLDFSKVTADSVIDLQGRTLFLADETSAALSAFTITDTSQGTPGTVRVSVASGTLSNSSVALSGNLRLQKEGAGIFVPAKASQTYTGGTDVSNGTIRINATVSGHFGTGAVTVPTDAVFDVNGKDATDVKMVLAGGTLQNSATIGATLPKTLTLTADSRVVHANTSSDTNDMTVPNQCNWNLGGKTLSISMTGRDSDFGFRANGPNVVSNGTISVTVGTTSGTTKGYFAIRQINGKDGLRLDLGNTYLRMQDGVGNSSVMDFTANPVGDVYNQNNNRLQIYGTFTPKTATGFNMTMMGGSMLDLSQWTSGAYDCAFPNNTYKSGSNKPCDLQFAANSTITVNLDGRTDLKTLAKSESPYVVKWSTKPAATTTFVLDETTGKHFKCEVTDAGLKLSRLKGVVIIVK